ncbi:MAG: hypothetical protein ACP5P1_06460 [Acidimicrobiales bacterium]
MTTDDDAGLRVRAREELLERRSPHFALLPPRAQEAANEAERMLDEGESDPDAFARRMGYDREALQQARDFFASLVSAHSDDFRASEALRLVNRAMSKTPIVDPLDWKPRWHQRFRRP